jgi:hypothetical protein
MPKSVTYNLPPYVALVDNPHYNGSQSILNGGDLSNLYAPYKLKSLGNYPLGSYTISVPGNEFYSGTFLAIKTTNTSITLEYPNLIGSYPTKTYDTFMDVNSYSFAYKKYPLSRLYGGFAPFEKYYDLLVYDFDANSWQNSTSFVQHHVVKQIYFQGIVPNSYSYGHIVAHFPELPFNKTHAVPDPTGFEVIPYSERTALEGRYFIFIKKNIGSNKIEYNFFPPLPKNKNIEIWLEPIQGSKYHLNKGIERGSGVNLNIIYDGFFWSDGGFGSGIVLPAIKNRSSSRQPALMTMPEGSDYGAFRFYSGAKRSKDFDLYKTLSIPPTDTVIENAIPCNFSSY